MASFVYQNFYINDYACVSGPKECKSTLIKNDIKMNDYYFGEKSFEDAEVKIQKETIKKLQRKNKIKNSDIDLLLGGDLLDQLAVTNKTSSMFKIPYLGLYNACATFPESLIVAGTFLKENSINRIVSVTSSHNLTAERQFRYPVEYGSPRKKVQTFTTTGAVSVLISNIPTGIKIESSTIGKTIDLGVKDANNMGAVMAPAAADTLYNHLKDLKRSADYYDLILTGDLGKVGSDIFINYYMKVYKKQLNNYLDAGSILYFENQNCNAGGSGPVCLPLVLFNKIIPSQKYKKILIIGTGALHSRTFVNQKNTIPAIAHAVSLEVL